MTDPTTEAADEQAEPTENQIATKCMERIDEIIRSENADGYKTLVIRENIFRLLMARNVASASVSRQAPPEYIYNKATRLMKESIVGMANRLIEIYALEKTANDNEEKKEKQT